jgi:uncharacterized protein (DUF2235 family)
MAGSSRNLVVLSDGTGNSASAASKTNVWRLYQALKLNDGSQVAEFGDGVGTSSISFLRVLGLALGFGVKRNVVSLYKFLCRNYHSADPAARREADRIWMFGFSRGAFTIRVLAGLVHCEGLVVYDSEAELDRNAIAAYRAYRKKRFPAKSHVAFWVPLGRYVRDKVVALVGFATGAKPYREVEKNNKHVKIHFVGVWDTVVAYGLPIDELTTAVDKWIWPMKFRDGSLLESVQHARHALALDDERRTFHPVPWHEATEQQLVADKKVPAGRLLQVWFAGMHADVGGGYPDDGLSFVPLCWMIDEAAAKDLEFEDQIVQMYRALASPTGKMYDSRGGLVGGLWRYQPRSARLLMNRKNDYDYDVPDDSPTRPLVHHSAVTRMTYGNDGYAPISLPPGIDFLLPDNTQVPFQGRKIADRLSDVQAKLDAQAAGQKDPALARMKTVLADLGELAGNSPDEVRGKYFDLVLDTVWWRRCVYFVTLGLALLVLAYPAIYSALDWSDKTEKQTQIFSGAVNKLLATVQGFLPSYASPWVDAVTHSAQLAVNIVLAFIICLVLSSFLRKRIQDRARLAWNAQPKVDGKPVDRKRLTGQRHALLAATIVFGVVAYFSYGNDWSFRAALAAALLCLGLWAFRLKRPQKVDVDTPLRALQFARTVRTTKPLVGFYRWLARTALPAGFFVVIAVLAFSAVNLLLFNLQSTTGKFCPSGEREQDPAKNTATIDISSLCARTGLQLVAGQRYRIQIEPGYGSDNPADTAREPKKEDKYAWFDKGTPADVGGFTANSLAHYVGAPLRRWWREDYFQPIARVGNVGNYEYALRPAAPLPKVDFRGCGKVSKEADKTGNDSPAPEPARLAELACERRAENNVKRNDVLIADLVPDATGELYIYVNDTVLFWEGADSTFYKNNNGQAKVTVTPILAPEIIKRAAAQQAQGK